VQPAAKGIPELISKENRKKAPQDSLRTAVLYSFVEGDS
jgi:hypothetical protein